MASTSKCEYCGATILSSDTHCPNCGAPNPKHVPEKLEKQMTVVHPRTIEELKLYCSERNMPLLRMRFFIGEDFKEPRAFGIYKEGGNSIVYKNKRDGSRSIRYSGPDEEYAVNEIFSKLLDECNKRGIYPENTLRSCNSTDGFIQVNPIDNEGVSESRMRLPKIPSVGIPQFMLGMIPFLVWVLVVVMSSVSVTDHSHDGYYRFNTRDFYFRTGDLWYLYLDDSTSSNNNRWVETDPPVSDNTAEYYIGSDYSPNWGISNFKTTYTQPKNENTSTNHDWDAGSDWGTIDFDSWDSNETNWDSDW